MAPTVGLTGLISSSDTGKPLHYLINSGTDPYSASLTITGESFDTTPFASTAPVAATNIAGLQSWSGSFNGRFPAGGAASGHLGLVTFGSGYATNVRGWTITGSIAALDVTAQASTAPTWMSFLPGLYTYSGSYECLVDDTTAISACTSGSATFRISTESTNDNELAGNIVVTGVSVNGQVGDRWLVTVSFVVSGVLTTDGDSSLFEVAAAGTPDDLETPEATAISIRVDGSRVYSGNAFETGWTISSAIGSQVSVSVNFQGTGALTIG